MQAGSGQKTAYYHPQCYGHCEQFNSTLIHMLGTLSEGVTVERLYFNSVHAYNCTINNVTDFSLSTQTADLCATTSTK